jgi:hypothetical protein
LVKPSQKDTYKNDKKLGADKVLDGNANTFNHLGSKKG